MGREALLCAIIGKKGVGKTFQTTKVMKNYAFVSPRRRVLILDVNDEYTEFKAIALHDVGMFSVHPIIEIRRVRPFHANGKKMTLDDLADALFYILENYRNGMLLIEDVNKFISDTMPNDLVGAICTNRHSGLDIFLHYQSIGRITTKVWQNLNVLRFHKCTDTVQKHRKKFEDKFEYLYLAQAMVDFNYYKLNNKRFHLTINIDDEKIIGNYTDKLFNIAVEDFIAKNYSDCIAPLLRQRDASGKKNHTPQSAMQAVKDRLQQYRG